MAENNLLRNFITKNKPQFAKYKKYIEANDWTQAGSSMDYLSSDSFFNDIYSGDKNKVKKAEVQKLIKEQIAAMKDNVKYKSDEFKLQNDLMGNILDRVKYIVNKLQGDHHLPEFKKFIKYCLSIIDTHTSRVDDYINSVDISRIDNQEVRAEEIKLIKDCFSGVTKLQDAITALNIKDDTQEAAGISFLNETKAPLSMHWVLSEIYPEINRKLKALGVDPDEPADNTLHIYNENPPVWNPDKHYFDQEKSVLSYYFKEFRKLKEGIVIDGYYISGWMYYHMNVFVTPIPHKVLNEKSGLYENKDKIINPPLRDSDVLIFENHEEQKRTNTLFMFIAATRRAAKTTLESSKLGHAATIGKKELLCAGGSTKDLNQIAKNFRTDIQYKNPAFAVYNVANDWKDKVELGLKTKGNKTILLSTLNIVNTDGGNNVEILAGYTPDEFLYDEAMKGRFIEALQGLKPALRGAEGLIRCFGILSATGGDEILSADGITVINDPKGNSVLPMDWKSLERGVPEECKTWSEDKNKPFTTFIPGQMCVDMPKIESTLADYIGRPESEELKKIKLKVTDWPQATENIKEAREKLLGNKVAYNKEVVYIPLCPSDIMASGRQNPFPVAEAKAHRDYLLQTGLWDRRRDLYKDSTGKIRCDVSTKPLAEFPFRGSNIDAPFLIFEDPPTEKVKWGTYIGSFDDYKHDSAGEGDSSLAAFHVWKSPAIGDPFSNKIVASLTFRPNRHATVHEKWLLLCEAYQLEGCVFGENEDMKFKDYLDARHLTEKYLATSLDFTQTFNLPNNMKRKFGWSPSSSKRILFSIFVDYCNEEFEVEQEDGKIIKLKGVQRIDDIWLLEEIIQYTDNQNVDRISSVLGSAAFCHYLVSSHRWKVQEIRKQNNAAPPKRMTKREKSFYGVSKRNTNFYRGI